MLRRILSLMAILTVLACGPGWSQDTRGTITGRIADPSGAVVPGASVAVTNVAMGTRATFKTNQDGYYQAPLLMPGTYQIEVTVAGFKKGVRDGIEVRVADRLEVNFALEIGSSELSVTVTGELPLMNTESASLGTVVDSKRVADLPLSYGNPFLLIGLTAGV
ncbi:MAG TPA: carboxypeptidase-like regulatory domain-containing protein, partial [Bryobacteraceae bacterium]|nr:carboxypeptidase-like regulatory domain-containing protein [Bryobacteraceae bacterium]